MNKELIADQETTSFLKDSFVKAMGRIKQTEHLKLIWWCLALCILSGTLARYLSVSTGFTYGLLMVLGSGGCAWFWLLSRALFRDSMALNSKTVYVVPVIIAVEAIEVIMPQAGISGTTNEFYRVFGNLTSLVCIAAIVCVWNETLSGFSKIRSKPERRFRVIYLSVFSFIVAVAVLWVMGAKAETFAAQWNNALMTFCAMIGLVGSRLAVEYRLSTLRTMTSKSASSKSMQNADALNQTLSPKLNSNVNQAEGANLLADKVLQAFTSDALLTKPNLKVSDLADHIGEQEYKVTRCISSYLKYRNFNHMLNNHRIDRAIGKLKDPDCSHLKIAAIAFDCGYNSLGPFNRAFKQHTSMTPNKYRQALLCH